MTTATTVTPKDPRTRLEQTQSYLAADKDNPHLLAQVIDLSLAAGEREQARAALGEALRRYPEDPHFLFRMATFCIAERRLDEAYAALESIAGSQERPAAVLHNMAYVEVLRGRHAAAIVLLDEALRSADATDDTAGLLVRCLHHEGRLDEAVALAEVRIAEGRADASLYSAASLALWDRGDTQRAGELASEALMRAPMALEALVTRGSIALGNQDLAQAREHFRRALAVHPEDGRSWSGLALADMQASDLDSALAGFRTATRFMPGHVGTWLAFGWCQLALRQAEEARACFSKALELDRNFAESHGSLAAVEALAGNAGPAREHADRALRLDPKCLSGRYALSVLAGEVTDEASVRRLAQRLLPGKPEA